MLQQQENTTPIISQPIKKHRRKLPKRSIVDADLVSSKATDSARIMDDLLLPSEHDRIILSEIFDNNNDKPPLHSSLLPRVVIGVPNKRKPSLLLRSNTSNKTYKERLVTAVNQDFLDLSGHSIIPPSSSKPVRVSLPEEEEASNSEENIQTEQEESNSTEPEKDTQIIQEQSIEVESDTAMIENDSDIAVIENNDTAVIEDRDVTTKIENSLVTEKENKHTEDTIINDTKDIQRDTTPQTKDNNSNTHEIDINEKEQLLTDNILEADNTSTQETVDSDSTLDDTHYEQDCYVEIRSYATESMDSSSEEEEEKNEKETEETEEEEEEVDSNNDNYIDETVSTPDIKEAVKQVENTCVQSPTIPAIIPLSQALNKSSDEESEEWMQLDTDTDKDTGDIYEKIFNLMAVKQVPVAVPMETMKSAANKHTKLNRLKSIKALDWIENNTITNNYKIQDKKIQQIALKRKERLILKRQRPYVIRKRIKSIIWTENI